MADAMAANSGGVEWSSIIAPILAATYGSFKKSDVLDLAFAIIKRFAFIYFWYSRQYDCQKLLTEYDTLRSRHLIPADSLK